MESAAHDSQVGPVPASGDPGPPPDVLAADVELDAPLDPPEVLAVLDDVPDPDGPPGLVLELPEVPAARVEPEPAPLDAGVFDPAPLEPPLASLDELSDAPPPPPQAVSARRAQASMDLRFTIPIELRRRFAISAVNATSAGPDRGVQA